MPNIIFSDVNIIIRIFAEDNPMKYLDINFKQQIDVCITPVVQKFSVL